MVLIDELLLISLDVSSLGKVLRCPPSGCQEGLRFRSLAVLATGPLEELRVYKRT